MSEVFGLPVPDAGHPDLGTATATDEEQTMGLDGKFDAKTDQLKGKAKEGVGSATDDQGLEAEGKGDQAKGHLKEAAEKVKDVFKN